MKTKIKYVDEPKDGMELPEKGYEVIARAKEQDFQIPAPPPPEMQYQRAETAGVVTLRPLHGGKRQGAGRKPSGSVRMQICVSASTRSKIQQFAKRQKVTLSEVVERAVTAL
jgi:hypothetical protein